VVTVTTFGPGVPAGVMAVTVVAFTTVTLAAEAPPILTFVTPFKFAPMMVISVPPATEPVFGVIDRIAGDAS
jgi:hypothetical protein